MKKTMIFLVLCSILSSCDNIGGDPGTKASSMNNFSARILSENAIDYDSQLGVKLQAESLNKVDGKVGQVQVWVSMQNIENMPRLNDSTKVNVAFIKFHDQNITTHFEVVRE